MVKRIIKTQITPGALEKIKSLKSSSGKTSSQIIDEALKQFLDGASGMNSELLKNVNSNEAFIKRAIHNPNYLKLDNTKPANVVIDAAILSLWVYENIDYMGHSAETEAGREYRIWADSKSREHTIITRADIMQTVKKHMESSIDGTSWADFYKSWFDPPKYKGKFQVTVDNRIKSLVSNGVIQSVTEAEWRIIEQQKKLDSKEEDEKQWLKGHRFFAETGILLEGEVTGHEIESSFQQWGVDMINSFPGFIAKHEIGVQGYRIDIGVEHEDFPHGYIMAVETANDTYHSSSSARDRDKKLRQEILESHGWVFHRIWSTDWINNPVKEKEKLRKALEDRLQEVISKLEVSESIDEGDYDLSEWVYAQREAYYKGTLPAEKIKKLDASGFVWDKAENDWEDQYRQFVTYTKENPGKPISIEALKAESMHGGGVYKIDERNKLHVLAEWVLEQRTAYWRETLPDEKINKLDAAGIAWDQSQEEWDAMYLLLVAYLKDYPTDYLYEWNNVDSWKTEIADRWAKLGVTRESEISLRHLVQWVSKQTKDDGEGELSPKQSQQLEEAGLHLKAGSYTPGDATHWEKNYRVFAAYTKENPGIPITLNSKIYATLPEREQGPFGKYSAERQALFDALMWVMKTRNAYWSQVLPAEKIEKLNAAGFVWSEREEEWEAMYLWYKELKSTEFPNVQVPIKATYKGHYPIGRWVSIQRTAYNKGELTPHQINRLEKEGMVWDVYEEQWQKAYRALIAYTKENPGKPISENTKSQNISIGKWVSAQKLAIKRETLSDARMQSIWEAEKITSMDVFRDPVRGVYKLNRELSEDQWTVIMAILKIKPQRGISIPKIL